MIEFRTDTVARKQTVTLAVIVALVLTAGGWLLYRYEINRYDWHGMRLLAGATDSLKSSLRDSAWTPEERRQGELFGSDTIPHLMRSGLIAQYREESGRAIVVVNGKLWLDRSEYFKISFLKQAYLSLRMRSESPAIEVRDSASRALVAEALSPSDIRIYL